MTPDPDDANPGRKLDEDAAWRAIVEHYGDRTDLDDEAPPPAEPGDRAPETPVESGPAEALSAQRSWEDEGHFVPPEPPPLPRMEPRQRLGWLGLFGSPLVMLIAVVFGWRLWDWVLGVLVIGFVGGFVYLVATMPRKPPDDWSGDDGAVV